jgi:hypothetical protein
MPRAHDLGSQFPSDAADSAPADPRGSREEFDYAIRIARPQLIPDTQALAAEQIREAENVDFKLAIVRSDSDEELQNFYRVDIYNTTVASLSETITEENVTVQQSPATKYFYAGEVVGVYIGADNLWQIAKLYSMPINISVGELWVRPFDTLSNEREKENLVNFYIDYASLLSVHNATTWNILLLTLTDLQYYYGAYSYIDALCPVVPNTVDTPGSIDTYVNGDQNNPDWIWGKYSTRGEVATSYINPLYNLDIRAENYNVFWGTEITQDATNWPSDILDDERVANYSLTDTVAPFNFTVVGDSFENITSIHYQGIYEIRAYTMSVTGHTLVRSAISRRDPNCIGLTGLWQQYAGPGTFAYRFYNYDAFAQVAIEDKWAAIPYNWTTVNIPINGIVFTQSVITHTTSQLRGANANPGTLVIKRYD